MAKTESPKLGTQTDIVLYGGQVSMAGYLELSHLIEKHRTPGVESVFFVPVTTGGDPNAGYRIARALGHYYPASVKIGIPSICKSAGTLMCIGGEELVVADRGELGPLDIQLSSKDELYGLSSGLDILQALNALQEAMNEAFKSYLFDLKFGGKLGTKLASDIASNMAIGLVAPIAQQIDPVKLGEHQRAMQIAIAYGQRLNAKFKNTDRDRIERLLISYPAHGFVIDRKEICELFNHVRSPNEQEIKIFSCLFKYFMPNYGLDIASSRQPQIWVSGMDTLMQLISDDADNQKEEKTDANSQRNEIDISKTTQSSAPTDRKKSRSPRGKNM